MKVNHLEAMWGFGGSLTGGGGGGAGRDPSLSEMGKWDSEAN